MTKKPQRRIVPGEKDANRPETIPAEQLDPTTPPYPAPDPRRDAEHKPEMENPGG